MLQYQLHNHTVNTHHLLSNTCRNVAKNCSRFSSTSGACGRSRPFRPAAAAAQIAEIVADLPIQAVIDDVVRSLDEHNCLVLQAPPGAGKTTAVPLALLLHDPEYLKGDHQRIVVLEPRRVAAKSAARRMASLLGEPVGQRVGYRVKLEARVSSSTRIEVVTEGILLRRLQQDPTLEGVGALLLDEFHERSLDADTSLALALDCMTWTRPDLRLMAMSATLGGGLAEDLAALMAQHHQQQQPEGGAGQATSSTNSSSTDGSSVRNRLDVPVIISEGRSFPVTTHYCGRPLLQKRGELEAAAAEAVLKALASPAAAGGDVLVFLPGVAELRRVQQRLQEEPALRKAGVVVQQLHGGLAPQQQDQVIRPRSASQQRRVVLATPIAESSITIDGVTAVVDSGLARAPRFDPATGISRLVTQRIALDSAEQRRGRAGRTQPGVCYRLWDRSDEADMLESTPPEIASADLAPLALQLASWGCPDGQGLAWLDPPEPQALQDARELLLDLAAADEKGALTDTGRRMATVPAHPRFAHMVLRAQQLGVSELGCLLAAVLSERDLFRGTGDSQQQQHADLAARLRVLTGTDQPPTGFDSAGASRVLLSGQQILRQLAPPPPPADAAAAEGTSQATLSSSSGGGGGGSAATTMDELDEAESDNDDYAEGAGADGLLQPGTSSSSGSSGSSSSSSSRAQQHAADASSFAAVCAAQLQKPGLLGALVAAAYADRIAQLKSGGGARPSYSLSNGRVATLALAEDPLAAHQYIAVAELQAGRDGRSDRIALGAGLPASAIQAYLADEVVERTVVFWAPASKAVGAKRQKVLGSLVLSEQSVQVDDELALPVLLKGLKGSGWASLPIPAAADAWRKRAAWLYAAEVAATGSSSLPDLRPEQLMSQLDKWLGPHLAGVRIKGQLQQLPWGNIIKSQLTWSQQQRVDADAPTHLQLPTGSTVAIDYGGAQPKARVKLQEVFGLADTPLLGGPAVRVPLVLELLSPAGRPLQVTASLASFWSEAYTMVKKEMKGRYPRHPWPDDPANATPTRLTKKQLAAAGDGDGGVKGGGGGAAANGAGAKQALTAVTKKKGPKRR